MDSKAALKILLIDDEFLVRELLKVILQSAGHEVIGEADDSPSGLALAQKLRPDVILLDIRMPGGDGLDIIAPLRSHLPETEILMVTSLDDPEIVTQAIHDGAAGFVVKPFDAESVLGTLRKIKERFVFAAPVTADQ